MPSTLILPLDDATTQRLRAYATRHSMLPAAVVLHWIAERLEIAERIAAQTADAPSPTRPAAAGR